MSRFADSARDQLNPYRKFDDAIGYTTSAEQREALKKFASFPPSAYLDAKSLHAQNKGLWDAGFSEEDIGVMRKKGLLGNWKVTWSRPVPSRVQFIEGAMVPVNSKDLSNIRSGDLYSYLVDSADNLYLIKGYHQFPDDTLWVARNTAGVTEDVFMIKEAGRIHHDGRSGHFKRKVEYGHDLHDSEVADAVSKLKAENPAIAFERAAKPELSKSRSFDCLQIIAASRKGPSYVGRYLFADAAVMTGATLVGDFAFEADRWTSEKGRKVLIADYMGMAVSGPMNATLNYVMLERATGIQTASAVNLGATLGFQLIQRSLYKAVLDEQPDSGNSADVLAMFNTGHTLAKIPVNFWINRQIFDNLPIALVGACMNNSPLKIFVSGSMIRIYERGFSAILYYGSRQAIVGH